MREAAALELARKLVKSLTREENELLIRLTASLILVDIEKDANSRATGEAGYCSLASDTQVTVTQEEMIVTAVQEIVDRQLGYFPPEVREIYRQAPAMYEVVKAAVEFEAYLAKVNTPDRQSITFGSPEDDKDGLAISGFCERLTALSLALRKFRGEA